MTRIGCKSFSSYLSSRSLTRSTVAFRIGEAAKNAFHSNPRNTVFDAKRLIGRKLSEPEVQNDIKHWPFSVKEKNGKPVVGVQYKGEQKTFVSATSPEKLNNKVDSPMVDSRRDQRDGVDTDEGDSRGISRSKSHSRRRHCPRVYAPAKVPFLIDVG